MTASLYGIDNSNRDFSDPFYWGKNQFNSSFPVALACYMRDQQNDAVYITVGDHSDINLDTVSISEAFNTSLPNHDLFFSFETRYEPFAKFAHDELKPIDLVVRSNRDKSYLRALEIKLTTLPDSTTADLDESRYGAEIVVRNPTTRYMALSFAESCENEREKIKEIFQPVCLRIRDWNNASEIKGKLADILSALELFILEYKYKQRPLLMQPVWKTEGKSSRLANQCLDLFIWSDFALTRLFMDSAIKAQSGEKITRQQRTALRLARFLFEFSTQGKVYQQPIYDGMTYNTLNDKEFAISGTKTNLFMTCERLTKPLMRKDCIKNIILGGGQNYLSPERRFDAIIYFSRDLFD